MATTIVALAQSALGVTTATPMDATFWQWKHHANPFGHSYGLYAWDEANAQAAGARILMRWQFRDMTGQSYAAVRAVDTATHPAYQRQGIFSRLTTQAIAELGQAGVAFIYNTPNQKSLPGYLKMGWQTVAHWPLYLKLLRPLRMVWRRLHSPLEASSWNFGDYFGSGILAWPVFLAAYSSQLPDLLAAGEATRPQVGLRTPRTIEYLDWRYGQHPTVQYGVCALTEASGRLQGFAILRPNVRYGWQEIVLTELCLEPATVTAGAWLIRQITRQVRGDYLIAHFADQTLEQQLLRRHGFFRIPRQSIVFTVRPLQTGLDQLLQPAQWDLTLGDLEIF